VYPPGKPEDFRFRVVKSSNQSSLFELRPDKVKNYDFALDALTLKPSDFCNIGVNSTNVGMVIMHLMRKLQVD